MAIKKRAGRCSYKCRTSSAFNQCIGGKVKRARPKTFKQAQSMLSKAAKECSGKSPGTRKRVSTGKKKARRFAI